MLEIFFVSELKFSKSSTVHGHSVDRGNVRPRTEREHGGGDNNNDIYILRQRYRIFFFRAKVCGLLTNSISEKFPEKKNRPKKKQKQLDLFFFLLCQSLQRTN